MNHWAIYNLCNKKQYFICGSVRQYDHMFEMIDNDAPVHDIALVIWICSEDADLNTIESEIKQIMTDNKK